MKLIAAALIKAKANFKPIYKNKINPHFRNKYADLDAILEAIGTALHDAGLLLTQPTKLLESGSTVLITKLTHAESGESIESELPIAIPSDPQKLGASMTYYRRFSLCSLLAIAPDEDDDGNTARAISQTKQLAKSEEISVRREDRETELRNLMTDLKLTDRDVSELVRNNYNKRIGVMSQAEFAELKTLMHRTAELRSNR